MFDKGAHDRDYIDSTVVIARASGGMVRDKTTGEMRMGGDQKEHHTVSSFRNSMMYFNPVVIIAGDQNPRMPSKVPHAYCVLDYFKGTHIWSEKSGGYIMHRCRFEKFNATKPSWWQAQGTEDSVTLGALAKPFKQSCKHCGTVSEQVYLQGWMCLQPACESFWKLPPLSSDAEGLEPDKKSLEYDPRFLKQKTRWPIDDSIYPLTSDSASLSNQSVLGEDCSLAYWRGIMCPYCGRCNSRLHWTAWKCENKGCSFFKKVPHAIIPPTSLRDPYFPLSTQYTLSKDTHLLYVGLHVSFAHNYRINKYTIPGIDGFVVHMIANQTVIEEPGGADDMFVALQETDIGLRRRALKSGVLKGDNYTRHFLVNYGMPYKFIAATDSVSFEGAVRPVTDTRSRLNWPAKYILAQHQGKPVREIEADWKAKEFNEVLALGYFEDQKISYHDDGESGLGSTIATLSLGAPGTMRLRMKARHHSGISSKGLYNDNPPMPGCDKYDAPYQAHLKEVAKDLGFTAARNAPDAISMMLGHGDVVIMHGAAIQKYYEHAVEHEGKLRFALTCRYIDPDSLPDKDKPTYKVRPNSGNYDGAAVGRG
ncbi:hypothetical protein BDV95DRAFT_610028 [Massariosphaeria phaeospora]|uniref:Alpha-ketoglutarate-dependent dioxygenase AlkB-like domain-containing protein n=1 Tax=Massariosphaeria phaeospora TaxID=100035 RepID=A0A7C8M5J0_9PLEO|nr:hypothetical protein BDV95DRAFT_610028 [Massariosphaeria phaeospora]